MRDMTAAPAEEAKLREIVQKIVEISDELVKHDNSPQIIALSYLAAMLMDQCVSCEKVHEMSSFKGNMRTVALSLRHAQGALRVQSESPESSETINDISHGDREAAANLWGHESQAPVELSASRSAFRIKPSRRKAFDAAAPPTKRDIANAREIWNFTDDQI